MPNELLAHQKKRPNRPPQVSDLKPHSLPYSITLAAQHASPYTPPLFLGEYYASGMF